MIYAIQILDRKFVKIGYTKSFDVDQRICDLQTGCPYKLNLIFCVDGTLSQEQSIHSALRIAFGRIRIPMPPNEWYPGSSQFFNDFLYHLSNGANFGLMFLDKYSPSVKQTGKKSANVEPNIKWPTK